jgi:hypothetical protein
MTPVRPQSVWPIARETHAVCFTAAKDTSADASDVSRAQAWARSADLRVDLCGPRHNVPAVAWNHDQRWLAAASIDGTVCCIGLLNSTHAHQFYLSQFRCLMKVFLRASGLFSFRYSMRKTSGCFCGNAWVGMAAGTTCSVDQPQWTHHAPQPQDQ